MRLKLGLLIVAFAAAALLPSLARAQDIEKQVARMNKKAMEDYDSLEFDSARKTLVDAIAMLRANGYDETPIAAKTYVNLGIIYISGFKDVNRGKQQFVNALKINAEAKLDPALGTPELEEAFDAARKQAGVKKPPPAPKPVKPVKPPVEEEPLPPPPQPKKQPPPKKETPPPPPPKPVTPPVEEEPPPPPPKKQPPPKKEPPPPPPKPVEEVPPPKPVKEEPPPPPPEPEPPSADEVKGLQHNPVDEVRPNAPVVIKALLGNDAGATRLFLFFRSGGQEDYVSLAMKHTKGAEFVASIPAEAVTGRALQYYLEARDQRGRPVVGSGSAPNPYIVTISENAPPGEGVPEVAVEEDEALKQRLRRQRDEDDKKSGKFHHMFVFLMGGFGLGYEPGGNHTEVAWQLQNPDSQETMDPTKEQKYTPQPVKNGGLAIAPFHLSLEVGGMITSGFSLSLIGRFQVATGANAETVKDATTVSPTSKATGAVAGFIRARYRFLNGKFHPYIHLDIGYGQIRHMLDLSKAQSSTHPLVDKYTAKTWNAEFNADPAPDANDPNFPHQLVCKDPNDCKDTIAMGDVLFGGGVGIWYDFAKNFAFIFDVNLIGAAKVGDQAGFNADIQLGIGAHFL